MQDARFAGVQIYRLRILLRATAPARLHAHHAAILYALLSEANGAARGGAPCIPDGLLLDAPEQARLWVAQGAPYAFGFTLLAGDPLEAGRLVDEVVRGLRKLGRDKSRPRLALGGNYEVENVQDLIAGEAVRAGTPLEPLPPSFVQQEIAAVADRDSLTLDFRSPLRAHRSKHHRRDGYQYFDDQYFQAPAFLHRLEARLERLIASPADILSHEGASSDGVERPTNVLPGRRSNAVVVANELVWLDLSYGPKPTRKALGGAMGRVTLGGLQPADVASLVLGQYVRIGEATRFGFGDYRIEELGAPPYPCGRAVELSSLAATHPAIDEAAARWELGGGEAREAARRLAAGSYQPQAHFHVEIPKSDGGRRRLAIPSRLDRVLQRGVLDVVGPALDLFFEESSLAYRRGLGRQTAARRLREAFAEGYRWALRADFQDFFDSIDHRALRRRLRAYLNDEALTEMLMRWVSAGAPAPDRGVPTGAPLSPLTANLFLDEFDESLAGQGRRLVRYADDFMILFKDQADAEAVLATAREAAERLRLELNREKTRTLPLGEPFEFLGFRFEPRESWELSGPEGPRPVDQLGWRERHRPSAAGQFVRLPGESDLAFPLTGTVIAGPELDELLVHGENLQFKYRERRAVESVPLVGLREVIVIGPVGLPARVLETLSRRALTLLVVDESGRTVTAVEPQDGEPDAAGVAALVDASRDDSRRLEFSRRLIAAKLRNYRVLAEAYRRPEHAVECERRLEALERDAAEAGTLDELLGLEGAGAAAWYGSLGPRLPTPFTWERRTAPDAVDPPNILLNLAQTVLHRWVRQAIGQAKLVDSVGLLHRARSGHAALASDLQEPFRHLMDRAVLETLRRVRPDEFEADERGPYPVRIKPRVLRETLGWVHRILAQSCHGEGQSEPTAYRLQIWRQVRSLRRALLTPGAVFEPFRHP